MNVRAKSFQLVKDGSPPDHNDDAAELDLAHRRFAVSDGATGGGFSRIWSRALVEQFTLKSSAMPEAWSAWLPAAQRLWLAKMEGIKIPWFGEEQFAAGSFATFLGLVIEETRDGHSPWRAAAVGDTCLFLTRSNKLEQSFPLKTSTQFNHEPNLIGSRSSIAEISGKRAVFTCNFAEPGDRLWLVSDALAKWCLAEEEAGRSPWVELATLVAPNSALDFAEWIETLRADRGLQNDDVTLVVIDL